MSADVLMAGQVMIAPFQCVNRNANTMVTVHFQIPVHVKKVGVVKTVPFLCVFRIVTMVASALLQIHASVISGKALGEMLK
jgi:hypothetical protein